MNKKTQYAPINHKYATSLFLLSIDIGLILCYSYLLTKGEIFRRNNFCVHHSIEELL